MGNDMGGLDDVRRVEVGVLDLACLDRGSFADAGFALPDDVRP